MLFLLCRLFLFAASASATSDDPSACTITEMVGCYQDCSYASCRILQTEVAGTDVAIDPKASHEYCAMKGRAAGFGDSAMCGVEDGGQCFCGDSFTVSGILISHTID